MKKFLLSAACGAAMLGGVAAAQDAAEPTWSFTGSGVVTSNYMFRGISQTLNDSAIQFNARLDHSDGYYFGIFASGVNFGDGDTGMELDLFAGYAFELDEGLTLDISAVYYAYPGSEFSDTYNYFEGVFVLTYDFDVAAVNAKAAISPEFFGDSGTAFWLGAGVSVPIVDWLSASGNIGYQWVEDNATFLLPDYFHYDIGATISFDRFALDLRYAVTDIEGVAEQFVATLSISFP